MLGYCVQCSYWQPIDPTLALNVGECRVNAPVLHPKGEEKRGVWPMTLNDEWCGMFEAKSVVQQMDDDAAAFAAETDDNADVDDMDAFDNGHYDDEVVDLNEDEVDHEEYSFTEAAEYLDDSDDDDDNDQFQVVNFNDQQPEEEDPQLAAIRENHDMLLDVVRRQRRRR